MTEVLRTGARELLRQAIDAELEELLSWTASFEMCTGKRRVVRKGYLPERIVQTGIGRVAVPRVRDRYPWPVTAG